MIGSNAAHIAVAVDEDAADVRRHRRDRQPGQGHRRRRRAVDEPGAGLAGNRRSFGRRGGAVTRADDDERSERGLRSGANDESRRALVRARASPPRPASAPPVSPQDQSIGRADLALVFNEGPDHAAAGVFTRNQVKAAPVLWTQQVLTTGRLRAVILNSGGANACTGPGGFQDTHATAEAVAAALSDWGTETGAIEVAVCSTGLIGDRLPMDKVLAGVGRRRARDGRRPHRRRRGRPRHHDHRHRAQTGCAAPSGTTGPSAGWPRAPGCWRRRWPPCCAC